FIYPPASLPFLGLFSLFNFEVAAQLWMLTYLSLFAAALLALVIAVKGERRLIFASIAILLLLTSYPLLIVMQLSQMDLLIASLTVLSLAMERMKHKSASAALLSMAVLLKGSAVFLLIYFVIFRRDLQYLIRFFASTLVIVGVSLLVVPVQLYWYWVVSVAPTMYSVFDWPESQSLIHPLWLAGFGKAALQFTSLSGIGFFALISFYAGRKRWKNNLRGNTVRADAMFLLNGLVILLLSPFSLVYAYVWVILPLALFLSSLLVEDVKLAYLALVGFASCFLNSSYGISVLSLLIYPMTLPTFLIGNLMMTLSIIPIYLCPNAIFRNVKN
ncbi:MAG TPA: glycosyltransferase family 87 protein, partial [Candidatus Bathyarchaeia archaeon]|nr:glycosyltransferase family 87 protein [Candidatus Bathyarchaeia archaeon]